MLTEREVCSYLLNCGIKVRPNALSAIKQKFNSVCENQEEIDKLISKWSNFDILDLKNIEDTLTPSQENPENCEIFVVNVVKDTNKQVYCQETSKFVFSREKPSYLNAAEGHSSMFIERFKIFQVRLKNHSSFKSEGKNSSMINSIDSLIGSHGEKIV